jgi:hypothetical protein
MASRNAKYPSKFQAKVTGLIGGFTDDPPASLTSLSVQGQPQTIQTIVATLQAMDDRIDAVDTARTALTIAVANRKAAAADDEAYVTSVVASLKVLFEGNQGALSAFDILPPKARQSASPETLVVAAQKAARTRAARGTMSKQQRMAITANPVPTVTVSGLATSAPSSSSTSGEAAAPTPAPTAPPGAGK